MASEEKTTENENTGMPEWMKAIGSPEEMLHDLGMAVGFLCSAMDSLGEAISLARAFRLLDDEMIDRMEHAKAVLEKLEIGKVSKARVLEVFGR